MQHLTKVQQWRKAAYAIVAAVLAILVPLGVISDGQEAQWLAMGEKLLAVLGPLAGAIALAVANRNVHAGSDSTATDADVDLAHAAGVEQGRAQEREATVIAIDTPAPVEHTPPVDLPAYDMDSTND